MSIHTRAGDYCPGCNHQFLFILYHFPHCSNPRRSPILKRLLRDKERGL